MEEKTVPECPFGHKSQYQRPSIQVIQTRLVNKKGDVLYYSLYCGVCDHQYTEEQMLAVLKKLHNPQTELVHEKISFKHSLGELYLEILAPVINPLISYLVWLFKDLKLVFAQVYAFVYADKHAVADEVREAPVPVYAETVTADGVPVVSWSMLLDEGILYQQNTEHAPNSMVNVSNERPERIGLAMELPG